MKKKKKVILHKLIIFKNKLAISILIKKKIGKKIFWKREFSSEQLDGR